MQIVIMASGTRGDVQPMIALGKALQGEGHHVRMVAGANFSTWIEVHGLEMYPTTDIEMMMRSELGVKWVESTSGLEQLKYMKALLHEHVEETVADVITGTQGADLMISGFVAEPYLQAISEKCGIPLISAALQPYRTTRSGAASIVAARPRANSLLNRWMGMIAERLTWSVTQETTEALRQKLQLPIHTRASFSRAARLIPALYAISPQVVPPTNDTNAHTTGFWFLDEDYTPPADLLLFLEAGEAPVYMGFGSMSSSDPARTMRLMMDTLAQVGRRGVLARGWSGASDVDLPDHIYLLDKTSHTWLFPHMAAVVHHGGAGTTAAGLRAGRPTLIVPHMADQPFWGRRVHELGVGVKPIPRHKLTAEGLALSLRTLLTDGQIGAKAASLGERIRAEQGIKNAVNWISDFIEHL